MSESVAIPDDGQDEQVSDHRRQGSDVNATVKRDHGTGSIGRVKGSPYWYIWYYGQDGKQRRESTKTTSERKARTMLSERLVASGKGETVDFRRMRYEHLRAILVADYESDGRMRDRYGDPLPYGPKNILKPLDEFFANMKVSAITTDVLRKFVAKRKSGGVVGPTVNRNLALIRRMFMLAIQEGKLQNKPYFPMEKESKARKGFVNQKDFEQLRDEMPEHLRPLVTFLYESGCRYGAATEVMWSWVNLTERIIEIPAGVTKNDDPLTLPLSNNLVAMLKKLFRDEKPVFDSTNFRKEWESACVKIGKGSVMVRKTTKNKKWYQYTGLIPHDLRRSAVRNLINAGVHQSVAMKITGHRTVSVFLRYGIVEKAQLHAAMDKVSERASENGQKADNDAKTIQNTLLKEVQL